MDNDVEDELLMHTAAGTDLPTALAALPRHKRVGDEPCPPTSAKPARILVWLLLIILAFIAMWVMVL